MTITKILVLGLSLTVGGITASAAPSTQVWKGKGEIYAKSGKRLGNYTLQMTVTRYSKVKSKRDVRVFVRGRQIKRMTCTATERGNGWTEKCSQQVKGGGACFGDGLCLDYVVDRRGHAFATTIVFDGKRKMRLLRTELDATKKAVRFFRERLVRTR